MKHPLEIDIEKSAERITTRQAQIEKETIVLANKISKYTFWAWGFVLLGLLIIVASTIYYICTNKEQGFGLNLLGDFMAGTVASIWSLSGLFFIYIAFLGQKQQLLNQQLEIMYSQLEVKYTRLELLGQRLEMKEQNETLRLQRFENTFFELLGLFNSIVNDIAYRTNVGANPLSKGRQSFELYYRELQSNVNANKTVTRNGFYEASIIEAIEAYGKTFTKSKSNLGHYFATIYQIIKFIDTSKIQNKEQYISIFIAQLNSCEQVLFFYTCLFKNGKEKFKPLAEKYGLFRTLDKTMIINKEHLNEFEKGAYGE